jgi:small-conductance mechanosensitive channel
MKEIIDYTPFQDGGFSIKVISIIKADCFVIVVLLVLKLIRKARFKSKNWRSKKYSIYRLVRYLIILLSIIAGLQLFGFNLSVLVAGSAAL